MLQGSAGMYLLKNEQDFLYFEFSGVVAKTIPAHPCRPCIGKQLRQSNCPRPAKIQIREPFVTS